MPILPRHPHHHHHHQSSSSSSSSGLKPTSHIFRSIFVCDLGINKLDGGQSVLYVCVTVCEREKQIIGTRHPVSHTHTLHHRARRLRLSYFISYSDHYLFYAESTVTTSTTTTLPPLPPLLLRHPISTRSEPPTYCYSTKSKYLSHVSTTYIHTYLGNLL